MDSNLNRAPLATAAWLTNYTEAIYSTATNGTIVVSTDGVSVDVDYSGN